MSCRASSLILAAGLSLVLVPGCTTLSSVTDNKLSTGNNTGNNQLTATGKVALVMNAVNYNKSGLHTQAILPSNTNNKAVDSILSTAPEQMVVYLKSISGLNSKGESTVFWTSPNTGGSAISLQSGNVDLSALNLGQLTVPAGSYAGVNLQFARVAQMKGSVTGTFCLDASASTGVYAQSPAAGASNLSTNEEVHRGQSMTFCTRSDMSELSAETFSTDIIGHNSDYDPAINQKADSELVDVDLLGGNSDNLPITQIRQASIPIESTGSFTVAENETTTLTLAVDLNRMLRFYANTRMDHQPPNPAMKAGTSYFFTTVFPSSISVFGGPIGSVEGYQISAYSIDAWMTIFRDASGSVLSASICPDDDNTLTIMKGTGENLTGDLENGLNLHMRISQSTISGLKDVALNATGSATLTIDQDSQNTVMAGHQYPLTYQRLL